MNKHKLLEELREKIRSKNDNITHERIKERELYHGVKIKECAEDIWGWTTLAGKIRANRRARFFVELTNMNSNHDVLEIGYKTERMKVIPNGIDTKLFKPVHPSGFRLRDEWSIDEKTVSIGLVGRLDPMKDHTTFSE